MLVCFSGLFRLLFVSEPDYLMIRTLTVPARQSVATLNSNNNNEPLPNLTPCIVLCLDNHKLESWHAATLQVGDFDQWSRGVDLSGTDVDSDSVLRAFEATVSLLPVCVCATAKMCGLHCVNDAAVHMCLDDPLQAAQTGRDIQCLRGIMSFNTVICGHARWFVQGAYRVKFMVDGEWRLAPDWPTENNDIGETNNVLTVQ